MKKSILMPARITNVCRNAKGVELAIQYYEEAEISFVDILHGKEDFEKASSMRIGDEVMASPCEENKVYKYLKHGRLQRFYVMFFKRLINQVKPLIYPLF